MDITFQLGVQKIKLPKPNGFNPYFNGYCISTKLNDQFLFHQINCFNPYFNGYCISTIEVII